MSVSFRDLTYIGDHHRPRDRRPGPPASTNAGRDEIRPAGTLDHSQGPEPVEARDLDPEGPIRVDAELLEDLSDGSRFERRFFSLSGSMLGGMISRVWHGLGGASRTLRRRRKEVAHVLPHGPVGMAEIDVAAPDPLALSIRAMAEERRWLGIVDEHDVGGLQDRAKLLGVGGVHLFVGAQQG